MLCAVCSVLCVSCVYECAELYAVCCVLTSSLYGCRFVTFIVSALSVVLLVIGLIDDDVMTKADVRVCLAGCLSVWFGNHASLTYIHIHTQHASMYRSLARTSSGS